MSVRKRTWTTARGKIKEAWIVDYTDARRAICSLSDRDDQRIGHSVAWYDFGCITRPRADCIEHHAFRAQT
jgi:hypothetical protein